MPYNGKNDYLKWKSKKNSKRNLKTKEFKLNKQVWAKEVEKLEALEKSYDEFDISKVDLYEDFPLSTKTKDALSKWGFEKPTAIQKASILPALKGKDILGAAKTGSGKTLAFLIPILECLHRNRWNAMDGPGALVISPTRELALQTYEVLCKVGSNHDFSAGLVIGGKDVKTEARQIRKTNIVVCTPGRLLQHLDTTVHFELGNLKILVLDEADRILDLGFSVTINAVVENLPPERQTLLFSATQTKSVKDLARLSLVDPVYISVHAESRHSTPSGLKQRYIVCPLSDKLNLLYSFIRNHVKTKTIVFASSCKQVKYVYSVLCRLRPGVPVMHLHGRMNQIRRMAVYQEFCRKKFALLIATDIAARGLDFPAIDWVMQLDCPEDAETYIHRVGRTARFHGSGNALLILLPSEEEGILKQLKLKKVPIELSEVNTNKLTKIDSRLQSFCAEDQELKQQAQRCFVAYFRSVHLMKNKSIFKAHDLPRNEFATSLGLAFPPRVRFLDRLSKKQTGSTIEDIKAVSKLSAFLKSSKEEGKADGFDVSDDEQENLFSMKKVDAKAFPDDLSNDMVELEETREVKPKKKLTKAKIAKKLYKKGIKVNSKITFGDDGKIETSWPPREDEVLDSSEDENFEETSGGINIEEAILDMKERDLQDRESRRQKVAKKHKEASIKAKERRRQQTGQTSEFGVEIGGGEFSTEEFEENDEAISNVSHSQDIHEEIDAIPSKRRKINSAPSETMVDKTNDSAMMSLQEQEDLVLHLLNK